jgi:ribose transport system permease protein
MAAIASQDKVGAWRSEMRRSLGPLVPVTAGLAVFVAAAIVLRPSLIDTSYLLVTLRQVAPLAILVIGQSLVMRCHSIDLSSAGIFLMVNYAATSGLLSALSPVQLVAACLLASLAVGIINGVFVAVVRASAIIVTLAMSMILTGIVVSLSNYAPPGDVPALFRFFGIQRLYGIPWPVLVWIAVAACASLALKLTVFGRVLDAVGDNPRAAEIAGLPVTSVVLTCHALAGLTSGLAAILMSGFIGVGTTTASQAIVLNSIAATIVGGVGFGIGAGGIVGPALGAVFLTFSFNFLTGFGLTEAGRLVIQGLIIAAAASFQAWNRN